ncbi:MAG: hypothetical protein J6A63_01320 [Clostridia bacterium]|nr:hypothetical protein [Clostridia bacterium]
MKKRLIAFIGACLVSACLAFGACGGMDNSTSSGNMDSSTTQSSTAGMTE